MHMMDALLSPAVGLSMGAISAAAIGLSVAKVKNDEFNEKKIPIMGVAGAMVFAAQMVDFVIPLTGSSGHIGGGILLSGLIGGIPAFLSITAVIIIQCLFFADGGLLALGCNIFNLGVIPCLLIYPLVFKPLMKNGKDYRRFSVASLAAVIIGLELGAFCVVLQTTLSGITVLPFSTFLLFMLPIHLAIGFVEGIVTAAILYFIYKMRPELIDSSYSIKKPVIALLALTIITGGVLSVFSSPDPDGLEWSIEKASKRVLGVEAELEAEGGIYDVTASISERTALMPDYEHSTAGIVGSAITFVFAAVTGLVITKVKKRKNRETNV